MKIEVGTRVVTPLGKHGTVEAIGHSVCILCDGEQHPCYYDASELQPETEAEEGAESNAATNEKSQGNGTGKAPAKGATKKKAAKKSASRSSK